MKQATWIWNVDGTECFRADSIDYFWIILNRDNNYEVRAVVEGVGHILNEFVEVENARDYVRKAIGVKS